MGSRFSAVDFQQELLSSPVADREPEGSYHHMQFVLRLSQRNHHLLEGIGSGIASIKDVLGRSNPSLLDILTRNHTLVAACRINFRGS